MNSHTPAVWYHPTTPPYNLRRRPTTRHSIFPIYNNRAVYTPQQCEVDSCNEHVGQGGGQPHLHGDPFGDEAPTKCLYGPSNYTGEQ